MCICKHIRVRARHAYMEHLQTASPCALCSPFVCLPTQLYMVAGFLDLQWMLDGTGAGADGFAECAPGLFAGALSVCTFGIGTQAIMRACVLLFCDPMRSLAATCCATLFYGCDTCVAPYGALPVRVQSASSCD